MQTQLIYRTSLRLLKYTLYMSILLLVYILISVSLCEVSGKVFSLYIFRRIRHYICTRTTYYTILYSILTYVYILYM